MYRIHDKNELEALLKSTINSSNTDNKNCNVDTLWNVTPAIGYSYYSKECLDSIISSMTIYMHRFISNSIEDIDKAIEQYRSELDNRDNISKQDRDLLLDKLAHNLNLALGFRENSIDKISDIFSIVLESSKLYKRLKDEELKNKANLIQHMYNDLVIYIFEKLIEVDIFLNKNNLLEWYVSDNLLISKNKKFIVIDYNDRVVIDKISRKDFTKSDPTKVEEYKKSARDRYKNIEYYNKKL